MTTEGHRMQDFKLANVLFEANDRMDAYPALYCRTTKPLPIDAAGRVVTLFPRERFDFATYFNALSNRKWHLYTNATSFSRHLELRGGACAVELTHVDTYQCAERRIPGCIWRKEASDDWVSLDLDFPTSSAELLAFRITTLDDAVLLRNGYYHTKVDEGDIRDVELALCTTTFKKEEFILPNIQMIRDQILSSDERIADHFRMIVVDNGRTLDAGSLSHDGVQVLPNPNVGGSGGFARGMIEATRDPSVTNVLLMDDDVSVSPESFRRTFNLLSIVRDEYADAFVGGGMLNFDLMDQQHEDLGFMNPNGWYEPVKPPLSLSKLHDVAYNEAIRPGSDQQTYAAWWYCCIPVATIHRVGLPLPLFVRGDDVEYSLRARPRFMTMNGICVWHLAFTTKYNAQVERYQVIRNGFILQAASQVAQECNLLGWFRSLYGGEITRFNYDSAELMLIALEDFLRGPACIEDPGQGERNLKELGRLNERVVPLDELPDDFGEELHANISRLQVDEWDKPGLRQRLRKHLTLNGNRLTRGTLDPTPVFIPYDGWCDPSSLMRGHSTVIAVDPSGENGAVRHLDRARYHELQKRFHADTKRFKHEYADVAKTWRE
ncbi:MAG: glycosyltransferase family 2 protein, partial [Atopobium sp.]|nr:glycosyltransferase family 2 protein [Atopobium sp.]